MKSLQSVSWQACMYPTRAGVQLYICTVLVAAFKTTIKYYTIRPWCWGFLLQWYFCYNDIFSIMTWLLPVWSAQTAIYLHALCWLCAIYGIRLSWGASGFQPTSWHRNSYSGAKSAGSSLASARVWRQAIAHRCELIPSAKTVSNIFFCSLPEEGRRLAPALSCCDVTPLGCCPHFIIMAQRQIAMSGWSKAPEVKVTAT